MSQFRFGSPHVDSAAATKFHPAVTLQLAISGADRVGMQMKAPRQVARRGQTLAGREVVAQNAEHDLRHQLLANRDFASARKPELHGADMIARALALLGDR